MKQKGKNINWVNKDVYILAVLCGSHRQQRAATYKVQRREQGSVLPEKSRRLGRALLS